MIPAYQQVPQGHPQPQGMYPQQMPAGHPQVPGMPMAQMPNFAAQFQQIGTPVDLINQMDMIYLKQKTTIGFGGIDANNVYYVYQLWKDPYTGKKMRGHKMFTCKSKSTKCERLAHPACRAFRLDIFAKIYDPRVNKYVKVNFLRLHRPCRCVCLCCNRPYVDVYSTTGDKTAKHLLGVISEPFTGCGCKYALNITPGMKGKDADTKERRVFKVKRRQNCCETACAGNITFNIENDQKTEVGSIKKLWGGWKKEMITDSDNFEAQFPKMCTWDQKALILAAMIFIDFRCFEEPQRKGKFRIH
jgi:hypothetical protein